MSEDKSLMPRVNISSEIAENLRRIDAIKDRIAAGPIPSEDELSRLERKFYEETVYYTIRLSHPEGSGD